MKNCFMKKLLSSFLALTMVATVVPANVVSAAEGQTQVVKDQNKQSQAKKASKWSDKTKTGLIAGCAAFLLAAIQANLYFKLNLAKKEAEELKNMTANSTNEEINDQLKKALEEMNGVVNQTKGLEEAIKNATKKLNITNKDAMVTVNPTSEEIKSQFEHIKNWLIGELSQQKNANATMTSKNLSYDGEFDLRDGLSKKDLDKILKDNLYDIVTAMRAMDIRTGNIENQLEERLTSTPNLYWWLITVAATSGAVLMPTFSARAVATFFLYACGFLIDGMRLFASDFFDKRKWNLLELMSSNNNTESVPTLTSKNATNNTKSAPTLSPTPTLTSKNATNKTEFSPSPTPALMPTR